MVNTETAFWVETARNWPFPEIFILAAGVGRLATLETRLRDPLSATLNVLIVPLLEAIRKLPLGVAASEMPAQLSSVSPLANGDPAT